MNIFSLWTIYLFITSLIRSSTQSTIQTIFVLLIQLINNLLDRYGEVAPLEVFMGIPTPVKTNQFWKILKKGDIVIGKVTVIKTFGLFIQILDLEFSRRRDLIDSNVQVIHFI